VPKLWYNLGDAALEAMLRPGITVTARCGITYTLEERAGMPCLVCRLLNGKPIFYMNAKLAPEPNQWGRRYWTHWKISARTKQWSEHMPYSHQLAENVVQGLARELLADAMLRFEARGYPVVLHVHDEIVVEHPLITEELIREIMETREKWAVELDVPVRVEAWVGKRYCK